jgi:hypothetical protein
MRRLTLILSDLYLPSETDVEMPEAAALPNLAWLLSVAGRRQLRPDWRRVMAAEIGRFDLLGHSLAQVACLGKIAEAQNGWLATPVNLEARLDHVRLTPRGVLALPPEQRAAWCAEFARAFGPELALHEVGPRDFVLVGLPALTAQTQDPSRLLGCDISHGLPAGPDANVLRRLGAEIEMWAHGCTLNREREKRREPVVSALWLWGGNGFPQADSGPAEARHSLAIAGEDACLAGLCRQVLGHDPIAVPEALGAFAPHAEHLIAEFRPMTDVRQALAHLDAHWFGPAREALTGGQLIELQICANDRLFQVVNLDRLAFWRRRHSWIESLRRAANMPKA